MMKAKARLKWSLVLLLAVAGSLVGACKNGPDIPHPLAGQEDCLSCHGLNTDNPYPEGHARHQYDNSQCAKCHKPAETVEGE